MRLPIARGLVLLAAGFSVLHCYPVGYDYTDELDTVVTWRNEDADYSRLRTYDVPDEVLDLCEVTTTPGEGGASASLPEGLGGRGAGDCEEVSHAFDDDILAAIHRNMEELGYERVEATGSETPDVVVVPGIVAGSVWVVYQYYPWCWYYPYYAYCGWYPPGGSVGIKYPTGTIVMSMLPTEEASDADDPPRTLWVGGVHGLTSTGESTSSVRARIEKNIDQAFAQSPYLEVSDQ